MRITRQVNFRAEREEYERFEAACKDNDERPGQALRKLMNAYARFSKRSWSFLMEPTAEKEGKDAKN